MNDSGAQPIVRSASLLSASFLRAWPAINAKNIYKNDQFLASALATSE